MASKSIQHTLETPNNAGVFIAGFVRLPQVLAVFPVSKSTWWNGVKDGRFPAGVKLGPRTTAWRVEDVRALVEKVNAGGAR